MRLPASDDMLLVGRVAATGKAATDDSGLDATDRALQVAIAPVVAAGGNVLLPCDGVGRTLELLLRLESWWDTGVHGDLFFLSTAGSNILEFARSVTLASSNAEKF
jgi:Cft2 family RNA processing exonuclease